MYMSCQEFVRMQASTKYLYRDVKVVEIFSSVTENENKLD